MSPSTAKQATMLHGTASCKLQASLSVLASQYVKICDARKKVYKGTVFVFAGQQTKIRTNKQQIAHSAPAGAGRRPGLGPLAAGSWVTGTGSRCPVSRS
jgi:hypothetical protein